MVQRRIPLTVYRPARAGVHSFAVLGALEAAARSILISVYPVLMYRALGDAEAVSEAYVGIGLGALACALFAPVAAQYVPRSLLYTFGAMLLIAGNLLAIAKGIAVTPLAVLLNAVGLVIMTVCFNAYVMDYIERTSLGRNESARLLYSAAAWSIGPYLGVWLMQFDPALPFALSTAACLLMLGWFWSLRLGNGKVITRSRRAASNPLVYLPRFLRQPSLVAGWLFSVFRSVGWGIYLVFVPIFAVEAGLGDQIGGMVASLSNAFLFCTPVMLRFMTLVGIRNAIIGGFSASGLLFVSASFAHSLPATAIGMIVAGTLFLVLLDICAGLPFLMAVKPSDRTEMSAVYSTFRDVSAVVAPALARLSLVFLPLSSVFAVAGLTLLGCAVIARRTHPRLGRKRVRIA